MTYSKKQAEFDVEKWLKSESVGHDLCGDFEFCAKCDKSLENPCAAAYDGHYAPAPAKKKAVKSTTEAKKAAAPRKVTEKATVTITEKEQTLTTRNKTTGRKR